MKHKVFCGSLTAVLFLVVSLCGLAQQQSESLADLAKKEQARKKALSKPSRVYTDDAGEIRNQSAPTEVKEAKSSETKPGAEVSTAEGAETPRTFSNAEKEALSILIGLGMIEDMCKLTKGKYVLLQELLAPNACGLTTTGDTAATNRKLRNDSNYSYNITLPGEHYEAAAKPRRGGLTGFLFDGENFYFKKNGAASRQDALLGDAASVVVMLSPKK
jgi:hypothetical protein